MKKYLALDIFILIYHLQESLNQNLVFWIIFHTSIASI